MTKNTPRELFEKGLITEEQLGKIEPIVSGKIFSLFYELQTLLYLGVMLFATGAGILIYKNIGDLGHLISIASLTIICGACFWYVHKKSVPYSHEAVKASTPYFDYILLLGSLLFVSIQGYLQFQYAILDNNLSTSTLVTSIFFFFLAYRYDHAGVLSLAITSFTSFWGIAVSPYRWYSSNFFEKSDLHLIAIAVSVTLAGVAIFLQRKAIKKHFTFTFLNFSLLIFFCATIAGLFIDENIYGIYVLLIYGGCAFAYYAGKLSQSFLFLIYAFVAGYSATTYLMAVTIFQSAGVIWFYYFLLSCGGFVYFIIKFKNHFHQES